MTDLEDGAETALPKPLILRPEGRREDLVAMSKDDDPAKFFKQSDDVFFRPELNLNQFVTDTAPLSAGLNKPQPAPLWLLSRPAQKLGIDVLLDLVLPGFARLVED
ncbi:MAG: hypothetical protein QXT91_00755 [Candidatus Caldarchaeum sp.]